VAHGMISGHVRDRNGRPLALARVYVVSGPGAFPDVAALTDEQGAFTLPASGAGTYTIESSLEGFASAQTTVQLAGDGEARVEISLPPG